MASRAFAWRGYLFAYSASQLSVGSRRRVVTPLIGASLSARMGYRAIGCPGLSLSTHKNAIALFQEVILGRAQSVVHEAPGLLYRFDPVPQ